MNTAWDIADDALADLQAWRDARPPLVHADALADFGAAALSPERRRLLASLVLLIERFGDQFPSIALILHAAVAAHIDGNERELSTLIMDHFMRQLADQQVAGSAGGKS